MTRPDQTVRVPQTHELKTWPVPFDAVASGLKTWELRLNDRDYQVGDTLHLFRFDPDQARFTDGEIKGVVTWMLTGPAFGLPEGYCIMTLAAAPSPEAEGAGEPKHWSDCAVHNEPAQPNGPCDCGGYSLANDPPRMIRLLGLDKLLLNREDRERAGDLRCEPDSEDNERFASWYGSALLNLHDAVRSASLQRPQTTAMLPGVETLGHSAAFGANVRTEPAFHGGLAGAVAFMEAAAAMLERGEMPAAGVPYAMRWAKAHRVFIEALALARKGAA
ncbi:hypothetical protein KOAAANKH_02581 [Brevundimonas sp. NIBR10]|uniref:ASCH/PUA domain-containing protein n=1 Tax=Brevundimonas sp. NIBR10 TaxID=3015997 RepID=UPI0022F192EB|nr:ASCH/PUA domain-containing protein [Brevundimonas sp. NIBR10]WGM47699.1 hypothetical protein KOAAANKH_02581 [Brevundimonas sp. NIBR10]